jgi:flagellar assembly protein FliH
MSTLIRSARFGNQPVLLERNRAPQVLAAMSALANGSDAMIDGADINVQTASRHAAAQSDAAHALHENRLATGELETISGGDAAVSVAATPAASPVLSYEEYEHRLGEKLEQMKQTAIEQGHAEGLQAAQDEVRAEYAAELDGLRALIQSARSTFDRQLDGVTEIAAEIVFEAVTKIIGNTYAEQQGVVAVVREVVRHAKDRSRLVIRVNPRDLAILNACITDMASGMSADNVDVVADDRVDMGGCLLETPAGNLDGRLEIQLQQLRDSLVNARLRQTDRAMEP